MSQLARSKKSFSGKSVQSHTANVEKDAEAGTDVINWRTLQRVYLDEVGTPVNDVVSVGAGESALQAGSSDVGPVVELKSFADSFNIVATTNVDGNELSFDLTPTGVTAGVYANPVVTFDANGRAIAAVDSGGGVSGARAVTVGAGESVVQNPPDVGPDLEFKSIGNSANIVASTNVGGDEVSLDLTPTGITARQYTNATVTFDANGRAIAAADGVGPGGGDEAGFARIVADATQTVASATSATVVFAQSFGGNPANTNPTIFDTTTNNDSITVLETANYHIDFSVTCVRSANVAESTGDLTATLVINGGDLLASLARDTFTANETRTITLNVSYNESLSANDIVSVKLTNASNEDVLLAGYLTIHQLTGSAGAQGEPGPAGPPGPAGSLDSVASVGGFNSLLQGGAVSDSGPVVELKSLEEGPGVTMVPSANSLQVGLETVPGIPVGVATNYATVTLDSYGRVIALTPGATPPSPSALFMFLQEGARWASNPLFFIQNGGGQNTIDDETHFYAERAMTIVGASLGVDRNPGKPSGIGIYPREWIACSVSKNGATFKNVADFDQDLLNGLVPASPSVAPATTRAFTNQSDPTGGFPIITLARGDRIDVQVRKEGQSFLGGPVSLVTGGPTPIYIYVSLTARFD